MLLPSVAALVFSCIIRGADASPVKRTSPTVTLDDATVIGVASGNTNKYLGIPFAEPPVGDLRYQLPQSISSYNGSITAQAYGSACFQQEITLPIISGLAANVTDFILNSIYGAIFPSAEDCLFINVITPNTVTSSSKLPVVAWIFGGGFEIGSSSMYDGTTIVERSVALGEPVVFVSMNYRLSGLGFLSSKEVKAAGVGNLGLQDQREALRWVQKYIGRFGGDSSKVTIWGESAGAISVALQMLSNGGDTEGLFRAGFMESGSPIPVGDITDGQEYYDAIVKSTGCSSASDTLACLRTVSYDDLTTAINESPSIFSYQSLSLAWLPRADGVFLTADPQTLVSQGSVARIPIVNGDNDDEGTLFSLANINITTSEEFADYITTYYFPKLTETQLSTLLELYPDDITQGSPYDTSILNAVTPQFKRIASFLGDAVFQAPRRYFLQSIASDQPVWSYLSKRLKSFPVLGSAHATDLLNVWADGDLTDFLINFVNNLNPNGAGGHLYWPAYDTSSAYLMTFLDGLIPEIITQDTYREEQIAYLSQITLTNPI